MPLTTKPAGKIDWATTTILNSPTGAANKIEYDDNNDRYELVGWKYGEFVPYNVINEWQHRVGEWIKWSETNLEDLETRVTTVEGDPDPDPDPEPTGALSSGDVIISFDDILPEGFIWFDNGAELSRTTYADIFARYGVKYGAGDGSTTFNVPDSAGYFMRIMGVDAADDPDIGTRTDRGDGTTGGAVGTFQLDEFKSHTHNIGLRGIDAAAQGNAADGGNSGLVSGPTGGAETRPKNINIRLICKI